MSTRGTTTDTPYRDWNIRAYCNAASFDAAYGDEGGSAGSSGSSSEPAITTRAPPVSAAAVSTFTVDVRFPSNVGSTAARSRTPVTAPARWNTYAGRTSWSI